ncbi:MAG: hypothetical protein AAFR67_08285, partial [Chloroflexota bacterium]
LGLPPLAVYYDALENSADPINTNEPIATFGDRIHLLDATIPDTADAGETISIPFSWQALDNITQDYRLFVHVMDGDTLVTQADTFPLSHLFTSNWRVEDIHLDNIDLNLPTEAGSYDIYIGLYNDFERLSVDSIEDNRVLLKTIIIE